MIYYCTFCGVPLTPGLRMCPCGQVFGHPVPEFDAQGDPGARYWPPRQPSSAEETVRRSRAWWDGISNKHKALGFGGLGLLLCLMVGVGARSGQPQLYQNPQYKPPTGMSADQVRSHTPERL